MQDVYRRHAAVENTLARSNFPLSGPILTSLADLTGTELVVFSPAKTFRVGSLLLSDSDQTKLESQVASSSRTEINVDLEVGRFLCFAFTRSGQASAQRQKVVVLFERLAVERMSRAARFLPLVTGLSTVAILTAVVLLLAGRLVSRLSDVQGRVNQIAEGNFATQCPETPRDEVGRLGVAINKMTRQLQSLWESMQRDQAARLLHQMAGGMAHQLRNTLTGSRLAIELHSRELPEPVEEIEVALQQIRSAEDYVSRILLAGKGEVLDAKREPVDSCFQRLRSSLEPFASHLGIELAWEIDQVVENYEVNDGSSLSVAVSNLVLNGLQAAANRVVVRCAPGPAEPGGDVERQGGGDQPGSAPIVIEVLDDGEGVDRSIRETLFEPFVSTKPEGCGLGLTTVRKSIERLGGTVHYDCSNQQTRFVLHCRCSVLNSSDEEEQA